MRRPPHLRHLPTTFAQYICHYICPLHLPTTFAHYIQEFTDYICDSRSSDCLLAEVRRFGKKKGGGDKARVCLLLGVRNIIPKGLGAQRGAKGTMWGLWHTGVHRLCLAEMCYCRQSRQHC